MKRAGVLMNHSARGGILYLSLMMLAAFCAIFYGIVTVSWWLRIWTLNNDVAEAACLVACNDLAKIVVKDPYFGYISLSNYPPIGRATFAIDGLPLPVRSINEIIAQARTELLVAKQLGNNQMEQLALADARQAERASLSLTKTLNDALKPQPGAAYDLNGEAVHVYKHALSTYQDNLKKKDSSLSIKHFEIKLGSLNEGAETTTAVPTSMKVALVPAQQCVGGRYKAFVDVPLAGQSFRFFAVSDGSRLVDTGYFTPFDGKSIASVIQLTATIELNNSNKTFHLMQEPLTAKACVIPGVGCVNIPSGILQIHLPDGIPGSMCCLRDVLREMQFERTQTDFYRPVGDFANEPEATLIQDPDDSSRPIASLLSIAFFDWLRTSSSQIDLDSLNAALDTPFSDYRYFPPNASFFVNYEIGRKGKVFVERMNTSPFPYQMVSDGQLYAMNFDGYQNNGQSWTVAIKDQVHIIDPDHGGKHAGQPLLGNPVNWCDLPQCGGSPESAAAKGKGAALGLRCEGIPYPDGGIDANNMHFSKVDGKSLSIQPRPNYYSGGLAVLLEIASPR